jgi:hypothetical protein
MTRYLRAASACLTILSASLVGGGCGGGGEDTNHLEGTQERSGQFSIYSSLSCSFAVRDAYGRGVPLQSVALEFYGNMCPNTPFVYGTTDANGNANLYRSALAYDCYGNPVAINSYRCVVYPNANEYPGESYLTAMSTPTTSTSTSMSLTTRLVPKPERQAFTPGLVKKPDIPCAETNDECSKLDFYRGADGTYDKVVVIAEPMLAELSKRRSAAQMWKEYNADPSLLGGSGILQQLYAKGYDVWIVRTFTLQDVWEQAAEFAQAVQYALSGNHGYGRPVGDGKAIVFGHSLGGLKARMATTRWDYDSNDAAGGGAGWRNSLSYTLGLPMEHPVPVKLIASGDAPHRGAQASTDLQWALSRDLWPEYQEDGFTQCGARQVLQVISQYGNDYDTLGWNTFYRNGGSFSFSPAQYNSAGWLVIRQPCPGGPPVLTQGRNGNGWPSGIKKIAWSQGKPGETLRCYGDIRDSNADGKSLCPNTSGPWTPAAGDTFLYINKYSVNIGDFGDGWWWIDRYLRYRREQPFRFNDDLESGGKHNVLKTEPEIVYRTLFRFKGVGDFNQYGPIGTFIPLRSALDRDCDPAVGSCPKVMDAEWANSYNAAHTRIEKPVVDWLLQQLDNVQTGAPLSDGGSMIGLVPASTPPAVLANGEALLPGQYRLSADGRFKFLYQTDGNLVLYQGTTSIWNNGKVGTAAGRTILQTDGNLVTYSASGTALWNSGTAGVGSSAYVIVQSDGNVVMYDGMRRARWATNTCCR